MSMPIPVWDDLSETEQEQFMKLARDYMNMGCGFVSYKNYGFELRRGKTDADIEDLCDTYEESEEELALALVSALEFAH